MTSIEPGERWGCYADVSSHFVTTNSAVKPVEGGRHNAAAWDRALLSEWITDDSPKQCYFVFYPQHWKSQYAINEPHRIAAAEKVGALRPESRCCAKRGSSACSLSDRMSERTAHHLLSLSPQVGVTAALCQAWVPPTRGPAAGLHPAAGTPSRQPSFNVPPGRPTLGIPPPGPATETGSKRAVAAAAAARAESAAVML